MQSLNGMELLAPTAYKRTFNHAITPTCWKKESIKVFNSSVPLVYFSTSFFNIWNFLLFRAKFSLWYWLSSTYLVKLLSKLRKVGWILSCCETTISDSDRSSRYFYQVQIKSFVKSLTTMTHRLETLYKLLNSGTPKPQ